MIVAVRYLIPHPDALAELGDLEVALYDGIGPLPEDQVRRYAAGEPLANVVTSGSV